LAMEKNRDVLLCRLVSRLWNCLATRVCQRRNTQLFIRLDYPNYQATKVYDTFKNVEHPPWSMCHLKISPKSGSNNTDTSPPTPELAKFLSAFGRHIRKLVIDGDGYSGARLIFFVLNQVPNLVSLDITNLKLYPSSQADFAKIMKTNSLSLPKLTELFFGYSSSRHSFEQELFELIIGSTISIYHLKLQMPTRYSYSMTDKFLSLLSSIRFISLQIASENRTEVSWVSLGFLRSFLALKLNIYDLWIQVCPGPSDVINSYLILEQFLTHISPTLKYLKLEFSTLNQTQLRLPAFPVLGSLAISKDRRQFRGDSPHYPFVDPFTPAQFPRLWRIQGALCNNNGTPFYQGSFPTVEQIELDDVYSSPPHMIPDFGRVFPSVTSFKSRVDEAWVHCIFMHMQKLESLVLSAGWWSTGEDFNAILSGIPDVEEAYKKTRKEIRALRSQSNLPSLLSLSRKLITLMIERMIKKLKVNFC